MFSSTILPQEPIFNLQVHPRRLLLKSPFYPSHQSPPPPPPNYQHYPSTTSSHGGFNANVVMVLTVLLFALICSLCVNSLIKCVIKCWRMGIREPNYSIRIITQGGISNSGLDRRALRTFPVVKYSSKEMSYNLGGECVICLLEFEEGDRVRVLPRCNHGFHVRCIDKWLKAHCSCPTCRHSLVDTCEKIVGCQNASSSPSSSPAAPVGGGGGGVVAGETVDVRVAPLEREDLVRSYRGQNGQSQ